MRRTGKSDHKKDGEFAAYESAARFAQNHETPEQSQVLGDFGQ